MRIGFDFDNTIVDYTGLFHRAALEQGLIPRELPSDKTSVRDYLRNIGKEDDWTRLQGYVYGVGIKQAKPYENVIRFMRKATRKGHEVYIVSHKTKQPVLGEPYDLHAAARDWLESQEVFTDLKDQGIALKRENAFFEQTKEAKLCKISSLRCDVFIDDLPEFLGLANFPKGARRVLFDPHDKHEQEKRFVRINTWLKACGAVWGDHQNTVSDLASRVRLWVENQVEGAVSSAKRVAGGANNQVYHIRVGEKSYALKLFFWHADDRRDRFGHETDFLQYTNLAGIAGVPRLIAHDRSLGVALIEWVEGRQAHEGDVNMENVGAILDVIKDLNAADSKSLKEMRGKMMYASEACLSLQGHLNCIKHRVSRIKTINGAGHSIMGKAKRFVATELTDCFERVVEDFHTQQKCSSIKLTDELAREELCVSPSDLGFHNLVMGDKEGLSLIDFEYAGLDDPAKLICDFMLQVKHPVPQESLPLLIDLFGDLGWDVKLLTQRVNLLMPLYRIKWACMMLNEFIRVGLARRKFAQGGEMCQSINQEELLQAQLDKSKAFLQPFLESGIS